MDNIYGVESLSVVIPAYNEGNSLKKTIESIIHTLSAMQKAYEIVIVDDGSHDHTDEIVRQFPQCKLMRHPANMGYGRSLKDGIDAAAFETIVITDADETYPAEDIPRLLEKYQEGFNMVVGKRTGPHYKQSFLKFSLRRILQCMVEWACGKEIPDINSGFRIFNKIEVKHFYFHLCDTFSFTTSLTLAYMMTGKLVSYIPINYHKRPGRSHVRLFRDSLFTLSYILKQILYFNPMRIFFLFGGLWVVLGALAFLISLIFYIKAGYYIAILSIVVFFIMIGMGLIAEQLRQLIGVELDKEGENNGKKS